MLDGLEAVEVTYKDILEDDNLRIEAEFYISDRTLINNYKLGKDIIDFVQYGTSKELNEDKLGFPILRLNEFESHFIGEPTKYCNIITDEVFQKLVLKEEDVLICRTNGNPKYVGKSALVMLDTNIAYASYLFKIRPKTKFINAATLSIFLNSKYGREEIEKYSMVSNQANFSPAKFREMRIPIFSNTFQSKIENLVKASYKKLEQSKTLYQQSEELLLKELDLLDFEPSHKTISIKSFSESFESSGRLDSEYYLPKYYDVIKRIENYKGGCKKLVEACNLKDKNYKPQDEDYYKYVELSNIGTTGDMTGFTYELGQGLPTRARRLIKEDDVIISSIEGSLEKIAIVRKEFDNSLCSTGFYVISSNQINSQTLVVLFKNKVMQQILKQKCSGTILTGMNKDEFLDISVPIINMNIQIQIEEKIKESFKLKEESKQLLEVAKRAVEIAIEDGEELAMEYIKNLNFLRRDKR